MKTQNMLIKITNIELVMYRDFHKLRKDKRNKIKIKSEVTLSS